MGLGRVAKVFPSYVKKKSLTLYPFLESVIKECRIKFLRCILIDFYCKVAMLQMLQLKIKESCDFLLRSQHKMFTYLLLQIHSFSESIQSEDEFTLGGEYDFRGTFSGSGLVSTV